MYNIEREIDRGTASKCRNVAESPVEVAVTPQSPDSGDYEHEGTKASCDRYIHPHP